jgi:hypothetical protein
MEYSFEMPEIVKNTHRRHLRHLRACASSLFFTLTHFVLWNTPSVVLRACSDVCRWQVGDVGVRQLQGNLRCLREVRSACAAANNSQGQFQDMLHLLPQKFQESREAEERNRLTPTHPQRAAEGPGESDRFPDKRLKGRHAAALPLPCISATRAAPPDRHQPRVDADCGGVVWRCARRVVGHYFAQGPRFERQDGTHARHVAPVRWQKYCMRSVRAYVYACSV